MKTPGKFAIPFLLSALGSCLLLAPAWADQPASQQPAPPAAEAEATEAQASEPAPSDDTEPATAEAAQEPAVKPAAKPVTPDLPVERHIELAEQAAGNGDIETTLYHYEKAISGRPEDLRLGTEYRQVAIGAEAFDRAIKFFEQMVEQHPEVPELYLNAGYAYVDKIPAEGAITAVILANTALTQFSKSLELSPSWLGHYTRGNSYMYWPAIFGRTELGIADLEKAIAMAEEIGHRSYHGRAWAALGDGYWRLENYEKMREVWEEGNKRYPGTPELEARLARQGEELNTYLNELFETSTRVETHLREIWQADAEAEK